MTTYYHKTTGELSEIELFKKLCSELMDRYHIDEKLASEMTWDFMDILPAIDGDMSIFEKYFLH
jgi:hypothetical protein